LGNGRFPNYLTAKRNAAAGFAADRAERDGINEHRQGLFFITVAASLMGSQCRSFRHALIIAGLPGGPGAAI